MRKIEAAIVFFAFCLLVLNFNSTMQVDDSLILYFDGIESLANPEGQGAGCKWKMIDCPGWGTGDYEACLVNGDGYPCSCGSVSRNCPD